MRKCLLAVAGAAILALAAGSVMAADNPSAPTPEKGQHARAHMKMIAEKLGLTPEQKEQIKAIMKAAHEQARDAAGPQAKRKIMRDAWEQVKTTVLTKEQRQKLAEMKEKCKERRQHKGTQATPGAKA